MVSFHVEPTSKCTLECPLCDRTWFYEKFKKRMLHEINVDNVVSFIGVNATVDLCGNNGDPIYHSKFLELCEKLKNNNCKLYITTNGCAKTTSWWKQLGKILDENDTLIFSIDGLEDTNHLYRKNAKWKSIMNAVKALQDRRCKLVWKFIVFKHNQHQLYQAKQLSKDLQFDRFKIEHSDRWLGKKELMPDREYIDNAYQHQEQVLIDQNYQAKMKPYCLVKNTPSKALYIDAEGDFYPCCWMGTYRYKYKSIFSNKLNQFNIANNTLENVLEHDDVKKFFTETKEFTTAHECCKIQCGVKNG
jgi:MoaA/NifB/PqqE/SkfB family radical SAM enzyme